MTARPFACCALLVLLGLLALPSEVLGAEQGEVVVLGPGGAMLGVDGRAAGALPLPPDQPLLLPMGPHQVVLRKGREKASAQVNVQRGRRVAIRFTQDLSAVIVTPTPTVLPLAEGGLLTQVRGAVPADQALLLPAAQVETAGARDPALRRCLDARPCQLRLARALGADLVLLAQRQAGRVLVEIVDVIAEEVSARGEWDEHAAFKDPLPQLIEQASTRPRGRLKVESVPAAMVYMDGVKRGATPYARARFTGPVQVVLAARGHVPRRVEAVVAEDRETILSLRLERRPVHALTALKWVGLITGGLALGAGIALFALDGDQRCERAAERRCTVELDGISSGLGPAIGGGVVLGLSGLLFGLDHRRAGRERAKEERALGVRF